MKPSEEPHGSCTAVVLHVISKQMMVRCSAVMSETYSAYLINILELIHNCGISRYYEKPVCCNELLMCRWCCLNELMSVFVLCLSVDNCLVTCELTNVCSSDVTVSNVLDKSQHQLCINPGNRHRCVVDYNEHKLWLLMYIVLLKAT